MYICNAIAGAWATKSHLTRWGNISTYFVVTYVFTKHISSVLHDNCKRGGRGVEGFKLGRLSQLDWIGIAGEA